MTEKISLDAVPFLTIDGNMISIGQAFSCLQLFGRLQPFAQEFLRYYTVYQEIQTRNDLVVSAGELAQVIMDFRLRSNLTDPDLFGRWLLSQGVDYSGFESQTVVALKLEKLKTLLLESQAEAYFEAHKTAFDQIEIGYAVAADESLAHHIKDKLAAGASFEQIAQEYPLDAEQNLVVKRDVLPRQRLRDDIQAAIATANLKEIVGPVAMQQRWCVLRIEHIIPAVLDEALKNSFRDLLFNQWLAAKLGGLNVGAANAQSAIDIEQQEASPINSSTIPPEEHVMPEPVAVA